jgi:hypothetical protein
MGQKRYSAKFKFNVVLEALELPLPVDRWRLSDSSRFGAVLLVVEGGHLAEGGVPSVGLYQPSIKSKTARRASARFWNRSCSMSSHSRVAKKLPQREAVLGDAADGAHRRANARPLAA